MENISFHRPRPKLLQIAARNASKESPLSPKMISAPVYSPVTDLAINLGGLHTGFDFDVDTPKRKLSLASDDGTPVARYQPTVLGKQISVDDGIDVETPDSLSSSISLYTESPVFLQRAFLKSAALQRFHSMPVPFCGFDPSPDASHTESKLDQSTDSPCRVAPSRLFLASPTRDVTKFSSSLDEDENSQDSGISLDKEKEQFFETDFRFAEPVARPPRRRVLCDETNTQRLFSSPHAISKPRPISAPTVMDDTFSPVKLRQSSLTQSPAEDDGDDGFLDLQDLEDHETTMAAPKELSSLFSRSVCRQSGQTTPNTRRAISFLPEDKENQRPSDRTRRGLFRSSPGSQSPCSRTQSLKLHSRAMPSKRSEPCRDGETPKQTKRRKSIIERARSSTSPEIEKSPVKPVLMRSQSVKEDTVKFFLSDDSDQADLVGDYSRPYALPIIPGRHGDLKSITSDTMAAVLRGEYKHVIERAIVVDCRYPYEYEGGHIEGAINRYTKDSILKEFMQKGRPEHYQSKSLTERTVIIFHCEFSSERGPNMSRFLRNMDRDANKECYPGLYYPEVYLLHNGYKEFFNTELEHCEPRTYLPMAHEDYVEDYKHFRVKSKSWSGERSRSMYRPGLKFL